MEHRVILFLFVFLFGVFAGADYNAGVSYLYDASANPLTSQANGTARALDIGINVLGIQIDPRQTRALTSADVVTVNGGATAALQTSGNATLSTISGQIPPTLGPKTSGSSLSVVSASYLVKNLTSNATTTLKTGAGVLHLVLIGANTTGGTIIIYDNTAASGTQIFAAAAGTPSGGLLSGSGNPGPVALPMDVAYSTGLTVVTAGSTSNNFTVVYQ